MYILLGFCAFLSGYLLGSVPFCLWLPKIVCGVDIRNYIGNIGVSAVYRALGLKMAVLVLLCELGKGIPALFLLSYFTGEPVNMVIAALGVFLGHKYSLFLGFRHRKDQITALGILMYLLPAGSIAGLGAGLLSLRATRFVPVTWAVIYLVTALTGWYLQYPLPYVMFSVAIASLSIKRMLKKLLKRNGVSYV